MSAPAARALSIHSTTRRALPARSPTVGLTWASAIRITSIVARKYVVQSDGRSGQAAGGDHRRRRAAGPLAEPGLPRRIQRLRPAIPSGGAPAARNDRGGAGSDDRRAGRGRHAHRLGLLALRALWAE